MTYEDFDKSQFDSIKDNKNNSNNDNFIFDEEETQIKEKIKKLSKSHDLIDKARLYLIAQIELGNLPNKELRELLRQLDDEWDFGNESYKYRIEAYVEKNYPEMNKIIGEFFKKQ